MRKRSDSLQSLDRGLEILQLLAERPYTVDELSRKLRTPRSTAYRTLVTLRSRHLVERDPRQPRYTLGFGILRFTRALLSHVPIRQIALGTMREIAASVQETAVLTVRAGDFGVAVESIEAADPVRVAPAPGERVPLHVGAPMKAILAFLSAEDIAAYLKRPLERLTARAIGDPRRLRAHLAQIRERGYAESWEEVYPGAVGVAVPLVGPDGVAVASLGIAGPVHRFTPERVVTIAQRLLTAGKELSRRAQSAHL
ncbi:MAG TPA: IclR family transcriptional regulator [Methylomirabilota bacterium]|jgi:DNA-binding IclR family transcriptional regulator|nr:IclR family transcriptional regulator [Methylomirabilota bacterium]